MRFRTEADLLSLAVLSLAATLFACSGSTSSSVTSGTDGGSHKSSDGGQSSATLTDAGIAACTAQASGECALQAKCNPAAQVTDYGDAGTCVTREVTSCQDGFLVPTNGNSAGHTAGCATALASETCAEDLNLLPPSACAQVTGPGATGSACSHAGQCASGFCAIAPSATCGTCQATPAAGASCLSLTTCGQTLDCYKGTCVAYTTAAGGACSPAQPCGQGLSCVMATDAGMGMCQTSATTVGAACNPTLTASAGCDTQLGLYCVAKKSLSTYKTCQADVTTSAGMPCGRVDGIENVCPAGTCVSTGDAGSVCVARAPDNAPCNTLTGPACLSPARCTGTMLDGGTSGTCTLPDPTGCP